MTAVIEGSAKYSDLTTNSWNQMYAEHGRSVGSGGLCTATGTGNFPIYEIDTASRLVSCLNREHTGSVIGINRPAFLVYCDNSKFASSVAIDRFAGQDLISLVDTLRVIRTCFGLTVTQLAEVMQVERVTIYAWMSSNARDGMRHGSRERLSELSKIASAWAQNPPLYGKYLYEEFNAGGDTVFALLKAEALNQASFTNAYAALITIKGVEVRKVANAKAGREQNKAIGAALRGAFKTLGS
jgi:hypothetical protein